MGVERNSTKAYRNPAGKTLNPVALCPQPGAKMYCQIAWVALPLLPDQLQCSWSLSGWLFSQLAASLKCPTFMAFLAFLDSLSQLHMLPIQQHTAWPPRPSYEICVEAFLTPQLSHSTCLKNQHHEDDAKFWDQLQQSLGPLNHGCGGHDCGWPSTVNQIQRNIFPR